MTVRPWLVPAILLSATVPAAGQQKVDFGRDVLPILSDNCFQCHGPDPKTRKADLRLDTAEGALRKDDPLVVPGKSGESELIRRLVTTEAGELMPPAKSNKKLTPVEIATLKAWIDQGAVWGKHWAYDPPRRPAVPRTQYRVHNPVDAFVLTRLEREGLKPSPEAAKEVLLRRVTLDLTGLPPTPEQVDAFFKDDSPGAYEKVVDRLLASHRYGERMAWDWLDAARYADTNGYQGDGERTMWPWRDWVVRALNANVPFDRFTVDQLAGDLLPKPTQEQLLATAFHRNHMINGEGGRIAEENRVEYVFDQVETTGTVWLGLTLTCARCHDHKFDPISRTDYYRLFAYFNQTPVTGGGGNPRTAPVINFGTPEQEKKRADAQKAYDEVRKKVVEVEARLRKAGMAEKDGKYASTLPQVIEEWLRKGPNGRPKEMFEELAKFYKEKEPAYLKLLTEVQTADAAVKAAVSAIPVVMVMGDQPKPRDTFILTRGAYDRREGKVEPGTPESLPPLPKDASKNRLALARWLVARENPLTARVTVNRSWQLFFGSGLVTTAEDFGVQGEKPTHPELLDWLATEFVRSGWDVKRLHRLIVTSATYRQSARLTPELRDRDPENKLLARGPRFRMPSWMIRDQALAASGLLVGTVGGPPVKSYQPAGVWEEATFGQKSYRPDSGDALYRRSLYVYWRRIIGPTMFFDTASRQTCTVKTARTNTPLHALATLNDVTYVEAARALAQRVMKQEPKSDDRLALAFRLVTARRPRDAETGVLAAALEKQRTLYAADPTAAAKLLKVGESKRDEKLPTTEHAAYTAVCLMILNLDEALNK